MKIYSLKVIQCLQPKKLYFSTEKSLLLFSFFRRNCKNYVTTLNNYNKFITHYIVSCLSLFSYIYFQFDKKLYNFHMTINNLQSNNGKVTSPLQFHILVKLILILLILN